MKISATTTITPAHYVPASIPIPSWDLCPRPTNGQQDVVYAWLYEQRNSVWHLRFYWTHLLCLVLAGEGVGRPFNNGRVEHPPENTFIGKTERGYDWMGAQMSDTGRKGTPCRTLASYVKRCRQLYGQIREWPAALRRTRRVADRKRGVIWIVGLIASSGTVECVHATIQSKQIVVNTTAASLSRSSPLDPRVPAIGEATNMDSLPYGATFPVTIPFFSSSSKQRGLSAILPFVDGPGYKIVDWQISGTCILSQRATSGKTWTTSVSLNASSARPTYDRYRFVTSPIVESVSGGLSTYVPSGSYAVYMGNSKMNVDGYITNTYESSSYWTERMSCSYSSMSITIESTEKEGGNTVYLRSVPAGVPAFMVTNIGEYWKSRFAWTAFSDGAREYTSTAGITFATMPLCAWQNSSQGDPAYSFQDVSNSKYMKAGAIIESKSSPVSVAISCDWGARSGTVAEAMVTGWSPTAQSTDGTQIAFTDESLALQLLAPISLPAGVRLSGQQSGLGAPLIFGSSAATAKPLWTWNLTSTSGKINPPPVLLTPRLMATKDELSSAFGKKTAQVTLILTTK